LRIGIAFDLVPADRPSDGPEDRYEEYDKPQTVEAVARVLEGEGHVVARLGDGREFLRRVLDDPPDLVWNMAEGEGVGRCREARVPAALEMLGIPYTGSDPLTLAATLDKPVAKALVAPAVVVPRGVCVPPGTSLAGARALVTPASAGSGPWIVKPAFEGSSKGIRDRSVADSPGAAAGLAVELAGVYHQPVLVEEFIEGDEVTVGLLGGAPAPAVVGVMRVRPKSDDPRFVYSLDVKRDWDDRVEYETPARLPAEVLARTAEAARAAFLALGCRDVARIDFRVRGGVPYFIEANPLPGLAPGWSDLAILAQGVGMAHADLIRGILGAALTRLGLSPGGGAAS
jgi:D-alanine-D-alanine ligase